MCNWLIYKNFKRFNLKSLININNHFCFHWFVYVLTCGEWPVNKSCTLFAGNCKNRSASPCLAWKQTQKQNSLAELKKCFWNCFQAIILETCQQGSCVTWVQTENVILFIYSFSSLSCFSTFCGVNLNYRIIYFKWSDVINYISIIWYLAML